MTCLAGISTRLTLTKGPEEANSRRHVRTSRCHVAGGHQAQCDLTLFCVGAEVIASNRGEVQFKLRYLLRQQNAEVLQGPNPVRCAPCHSGGAPCLRLLPLWRCALFSRILAKPQWIPIHCRSAKMFDLQIGPAGALPGRLHWHGCNGVRRVVTATFPIPQVKLLWTDRLMRM